MHLAILAALRSFFGWLLGGTVLKAISLTILAGVIAVLGQWLWSLLPGFVGPEGLNSALSVLPAGVWWVLDFFRFNYGAPLLVSAAVIAFLIRRLPVIG